LERVVALEDEALETASDAVTLRPIRSAENFIRRSPDRLALDRAD
jgi:hypothetical protein